MPVPRLDLDWEEGVFRGLWALWSRARSWTAPRPADGSHAVALEEEERALATLAQLICAEPVRIRRARDVGGVRGRDLLLPARMELAASRQENRDLLVVRTAVSSAMRRLVRGRGSPPDGAAAAMLSLQMAREACDWLAHELPGFGEAHRRALRWALEARPALASLRGRARALETARRQALEGHRPWEDGALLRALEAARERGPSSPGIPIWGEWLPTLDPVPELPGPDPEPPGGGEQSEREAPPVEGMKRVRLEEKEREQAVLVHVFEKVETADSYRGGARDTDGADELDAHLEALREVDLGEVIRGGDTAQSVLQAEVQLGLEIPDVRGIEPHETGIRYDEWDFRRRHYRRDWCTVYPARIPGGDPCWAQEALWRHRRLVADLEGRLAVHRQRRLPIGRQLDGEEIDLAAVVDAHASARAGRSGEPRLYIRKPRRRRELATTVLLDVSLSSDAWVENRRVLDVSREAVLVLGEVADRLGDRLQVLAFASHTRNVCRVWEVKGWREGWERSRARLGVLEPQGYTRIGSALRHATAELCREPAERRLLLLVSDGKATDYDRYEGRYGIADVRQALREAERAGVHAHALAVDAVARDTLPAMFGAGAWHVLPHPDRLPELLTTIYGKLSTR